MTRRSNKKIGLFNASIGRMRGRSMGEWGNAPKMPGTPPGAEPPRLPNGPYGSAGEPKPGIPPTGKAPSGPVPRPVPPGGWGTRPGKAPSKPSTSRTRSARRRRRVRRT